jgi:hypothetical protein
MDKVGPVSCRCLISLMLLFNKVLLLGDGDAPPAPAPGCAAAVPTTATAKVTTPPVRPTVASPRTWPWSRLS